MRDIEIKNARIDSTFLGKEDHGIPSFNVGLDYGGSHQGFGGYDLRFYGIKPIMRILEVLGVESWEKLKGTPCRAKCEYTKVHAIGHFIEDRWYEVEREGADARGEQKSGKGTE